MSGAYQRAVGISDDETQHGLREELDRKDAERALTEEKRKTDLQATINWLQATETQRMFKGLVDKSNQLIDDAIGLALVNHQQPNEKTIVHKLIEANTLRKVVENYANITKS